MDKARNYNFYGSGTVIYDQDLSAYLASHATSPDAGINSNKASILQVQNAWQIPFRCKTVDCICNNVGCEGLYRDELLPDHIRLLEILPGSEENIECRLHVAKLSEVVNGYEALSYTWQPGYSSRLWYGRQQDAPIPKINCNGHITEVGANLFAALRRIRHSITSRIVWADALCINQGDLMERSMQVQRMGEIFESAARVLIWLENPGYPGKPYTSDDRVAYRAFSAVCNVVNGWRERSSFRDEIPVATHSPHVDHPEEYDTGDILDPDSIEWQPVFKLFENTWFHRVWVIQEAVRAKAAAVLWEDCEIAWCHVGTAAAIIRNNFGRISSFTRTRQWYFGNWLTAPPTRSVPSGITNAYFMYRLSKSQSFFEPLSFTFHELLKLTRQFGCKDDRDRVYGLLGLPTSDDLSSTIKPDYTKSTQELYLEVARDILDSSSSLALLSSIQPNQNVYLRQIFDNRNRPIMLDPNDPWQVAQYGDEQDEDYPSWVPQWQSIFTPSLAPPYFHPTFSPSGNKQMARRDCKDKKQLELRGIIVDTIEDFMESSHFSLRRGASQADRDIGYRHRHWTAQNLCPGDLDTVLSKGEVSQSKIETLALLLTGGKNWYGFPVEDKSAHLADYAKCLLKEGCLWSIQSGFIFSEPSKFKNDESERPDVRRRKTNEGQNIETKHQLELQNQPEPKDTITKGELQALGQTGNADRFLDACATACRNRWFFKTSTGLQGIGPQYLQKGDFLCVLYGATVPFVIRPDNRGNYMVVGECFVYEIMAGEAMKQIAVPGSGLKEEWITLV